MLRVGGRCFFSENRFPLFQKQSKYTCDIQNQPMVNVNRAPSTC